MEVEERRRNGDAEPGPLDGSIGRREGIQYIASSTVQSAGDGMGVARTVRAPPRSPSGPLGTRPSCRVVWIGSWTIALCSALPSGIDQQWSGWLCHMSALAIQAGERRQSRYVVCPPMLDMSCQYPEHGGPSAGRWPSRLFASHPCARRNARRRGSLATLSFANYGHARIGPQHHHIIASPFHVRARDRLPCRGQPCEATSSHLAAHVKASVCRHKGPRPPSDHARTDQLGPQRPWQMLPAHRPSGDAPMSAGQAPSLRNRSLKPTRP